MEIRPRVENRDTTCYGIDAGPRVTDIPLKEYVGLMFSINAQASSYEQANPRHDHEWQ